MSKKIYIPNKGAHNYSKASAFGSFVVLTEGILKLTGTGFLQRVMSEKLQDSSPDDYILISGPTLANIIAANIFAMKHGRVNLLIYRASKGGPRYHERQIFYKELANDKT